MESALLDALEHVSREGVTEAELERAKTQLNAQLVFDRDSITNIAHQLGYFGTVATTDLFTGVGSSHRRRDLEQVGDAARELFRASNRTIGWFDPLPIGESLKPQVSSLTPGV